MDTKDYVKCVVRYSDGDEVDFYNPIKRDFLSEYQEVEIYNPFPFFKVNITDAEWEREGFLVLHV